MSGDHCQLVAYLDIQDTINHKADIVLGDGALVRYWNCHFLQGVNICYAIHLQQCCAKYDASNVANKLVAHKGLQTESIYECQDSGSC